MSCCRIAAALLTFALFACPTSANAQLSGLRGGVDARRSGGAGAHGELSALSPEVAQAFITVQGQVELRVKPTQIRVVLAVTAEGQNAAECRRLVGAKTKALTEAWRAIDIPAANIVEDFIAVLPRYDFEIQERRGQQVAAEKKVGYLMQTNMHVAVADDAQAMQAVERAFEQDVAAIIGFDYWSQDLESVKVKARAAAVKTAQEKSLTLLAVFDERPPVINVQESTRVVYPQSLYVTVENTASGEYQTAYSRRDLPQFRMFRPKNTYYKGLYLDADVHSNELPMRSEISVVSTVRLYFASPAAKQQAAKHD